jgi:hypothetical protein
MATEMSKVMVSPPRQTMRARAIGDQAMDHDFVDETAHQGLFLRPGADARVPNGGHLLAPVRHRRPQ